MTQFLGYPENKMLEEFANLRTVLIGLVVFLVVYYLMKKAQQKKFKLAPGPMAWPLLGNLPMIAWNYKEGLGFFTNLAKKYGPVYSIWLGPKYSVILHGYDSINEALVKKQNDFAGRPRLKSMDYFTQGGKDIALGNFGPTWKLQRKIAHSAVRAFTQGQKLEDLVKGCFQQTAKIWVEQKDPFNPKDTMSLFVYNIIASMCFGKRYELDDPEFQQIYRIGIDAIEVLGNGMATDFLPDWLEFVERKKWNTFKNFTEKFFGIINNNIKEHRETFDPENLRDITDHLIDVQKQAALEEDSEIFKELTEEHFVQVVGDVFSAGTDTSRETMTWLLLLCVLNPKAQDKMHAELVKVVGKDRLPSMSDLSNLPYCEAVLYETLRMSSVAPMSVPHTTTTDTTVCGYDIPKDTVILFNLFDLHFDPSEWKEPEKFYPERFLEEDGTFAPKPRAFMPFSAGRRVCLGEALAKKELHYIVALIFHQFTFSIPEDEAKPDINGTSSLLFGRIAGNFKVIVRKRN